jgi:hypothetical protein
MGCIFLAAKVEECPRKLSDVLNVFDYLRKEREEQKKNLKGLRRETYSSISPYSKEYQEAKRSISSAEIHILRNLGFDVHVFHPHGQ